MSVLGVVALCGNAHAFSAEQVHHGQQLFERCVGCHSVSDGAPLAKGGNRPLIGDGALPAVLEREFYPPIHLDTTGELSDFIQTSMPPQNAGTLREEEALALTALLLARNGVAADGRTLSHDEAERLRLDDVLPTRRALRKFWFTAAAAAFAGVAGLVLVLRVKGRSR